MAMLPISAATGIPNLTGPQFTAPGERDLGKASRQFESILVRQFLTESMKSLLEGGASGEVYGYLLTDSLANSISEAGGLGISSVIQAQLAKPPR